MGETLNPDIRNWLPTDEERRQLDCDTQMLEAALSLAEEKLTGKGKHPAALCIRTDNPKNPYYWIARIGTGIEKDSQHIEVCKFIPGQCRKVLTLEKVYAHGDPAGVDLLSSLPEDSLFYNLKSAVDEKGIFQELRLQEWKKAT